MPNDFDLANEFRQQLAERQEPTAEIWLPVPDLGEDFRFHCVVRRVDITQMLYSGLIPEHLAQRFLAAKAKKAPSQSQSGTQAAKEAEANMSPEDQMKLLSLQRKMAKAVVVSPKLVLSETPGPGEVSMYDLPRALITELFYYAFKLSPDVPVDVIDTEGKVAQTTVGAVEEFRGGSEQLPTDVPDGAGRAENKAVPVVQRL